MSASQIERDDFYSNRHPALSFCLSMIFSENRHPLFRIMLQYSAPVHGIEKPGVLGPPRGGRHRSGGAGARAHRTLSAPHAFFFTSLMLEKLMPSARSLV